MFGVLLCAPLDKAWAQQPTSPTPSTSDDLPREPKARLERAQRAYQNAEYALLRPLLLPILSPKVLLTDEEQVQQARILAGVGAYLEAQSIKDAATRDMLLKLSDAQFLNVLRSEPTLTLDALVYPASVIDVFEGVRKANAKELDAIAANNQGPQTPQPGTQLQTIYIQRSVTTNSWSLNLLPFGAGQFQNNHLIKGSFFAATQAVALTLNVVSYFVIRGLRNEETGFFDTGGGTSSSSNFAQALVWRQVQYGSLGTFAGLYLWSMIDGMYYHQPETFRYLRTLDAPPKELTPRLTTPQLNIGWSWRF